MVLTSSNSTLSLFSTRKTRQPTAEVATTTETLTPLLLRGKVPFNSGVDLPGASFTDQRTATISSAAISSVDGNAGNQFN